LCDGSGDQVDFGLGCDMSGEEGDAPIGSVAGINPKVALAEHAIRQADDRRELRGRRKGIQSQEDLVPGGTGCRRVDPTFVRRQWE
jgi:hypothetical protein